MTKVRIPGGTTVHVNNGNITPNLAQVLSRGNDGGGLQIKNIADPTQNQDALTLAYFNAHSSTGAVSSVFGRTGAIVSALGDYTASQIINAVDSTASYADPTWITSLAYSKLTGAPTNVSSFNNDAGYLTGIVPIINGGTGLNSLGTAFQQLRVNSGATALEYFDPPANPMTGIGDMIQGGTSGATTRLASVATGNVLLSGGVGAYVLWGKVDVTSMITGIQPLSNGGTNANLTASNGGIFYSTASAAAILSGTSIANKMLLSGATAAPTWSTSTIPSSAGTYGNLLTSDGTNWLSSAPTFWNLGGTSTLSSANTITGTSTNTIQYSFASLGTTVTDGAGLLLKNPTAAAAGAQQISPIITLSSNGWSTAGPSSMITKWAIFDLPVQGVAAPTHTLTFQSSINGVAYGNVFTFGSSGNLGMTFTNGDTYSITPTSSSTLAFKGAVTSMLIDRFGDFGAGSFSADAIANITRGIIVQNTGTPVTASKGTLNIFTGTLTTSDYSSGTIFGIGQNGNFSMSSGTANINWFNLIPTLNTTSTYAGKSIALRYAPTETSLTGLTHYFIIDESTTALSGIGGVTSPTAFWHIGAGSTTIAPLQINSSGSGVTGLLTTALKGAIEFSDYGLWFSPASSTRHKVLHGLTGASAPSTSALTAFVNYYGTGGTVALSTPNTWISIVGDNGSTYKIPAYS